MARRRGGGVFKDDISGNWTPFANILFGILALIVIAALVAGIYFLVRDFKKPGGPSQPSKGGGAVSPMSNIPGRIKVAEVSQGPSAGQAIIYFSQEQVSGITCETCSAEFTVNITYVGGSPTQPPAFKRVTSPVLSGTVSFDYGFSSGGFSPLTPGGSNTTPPKQVNIEVTARSVNPTTGKASAPTTFHKTIPYVA